MKILLLFSLGMSVISAHTHQELFLQAREAYKKKDFTDASHLFEQINPKTSVVWYNLGNCAYKKGDHLNALLYWQRAIANGTPSIIDDSLYNSQVAIKKMNNDAVLTVHTPKIPILYLQLSLLLLLIIFIVIFCLKDIRQKKNLMVGCMISVMAVSFSTFNSYKKSYDKKAFLIDNGTLFAGPNVQYHQLTTLPTATMVQILDYKNEWMKIKHNKQIGWIPEKKLARI